MGYCASCETSLATVTGAADVDAGAAGAVESGAVGGAVEDEGAEGTTVACCPGNLTLKESSPVSSRLSASG